MKKKSNLKQYHITAFESFLRAHIGSIYADETVVNKKLKYLTFNLEKENNLLTGKTFFDIIYALDLDLEKVCNQFFKDVPSKHVKTESDEFEKLMVILDNTQKDLALVTGISESRLWVLLQSTFNNLYADEVYFLAQTCGLVPHTLFEYCYSDKKKRLIRQLEFVGSEVSADEDEITSMDQQLATTAVADDTKTTANIRIKNQRAIFDYIVNHTDYFLTPRTVSEMAQDFKKIYNFYVKHATIYIYLKKYTDNELTKTIVNEFTARGVISKKPKVTFLKTTRQYNKNNRPEDQAIIQMIKEYMEDALAVYITNEKEEFEATKRLYDVIVANPGTRISFLLTIFDIKAKILEKRLQKLQVEEKIEYRCKGKSKGYWPVSKGTSALHG